jgi:hypothetical protein
VSPLLTKVVVIDGHKLGGTAQERPIGIGQWGAFLEKENTFNE